MLARFGPRGQRRDPVRGPGRRAHAFIGGAALGGSSSVVAVARCNAACFLLNQLLAAIGLPLEQAWLGILFTADPRWS